MKNNGLPQDTEFILVGGSIHLKIPPSHHEHLEIEDMKTEEGPERKPAKIMMEKNSLDEKYDSLWNPNADSQATEQIDDSKIEDASQEAVSDK